ncbi:Putative FAD-binding domain, FAD/NAD(P)-binding domain superfamily [Colletotrichum destructivum]|uniref:FAD-binding domain, FAD/NAD(P)-binding domain superfamily n=1 Tax=Colletotrichum destructivum TaxID=34406 RepID=A0AAX4IYV2_9PEZI|nr:Putative FAD-binding domain, FAD/NAD(P)-binding domain superfamily [Colletotrichum destructivum]
MKTALSLKVIIVGAGIGGLTCAIACRREGFEVVVLERASRIVLMGAGMQIPPNGVKVARQLGFLDKLQQVANTIEAVELRRYDNGEQLCEVTEEQCRKEYGDPWMAVHRADFHNALWRTCQELGVSLDLNMEVERIDFENGTVYMEDGDEISGDVIIGADGPQSVCRAQLLDTPSPLIDTGDVAYRAVLPLEYLKALNDSRVDNLCAQNKVITWLGPNQHAVLYSVRGGQEYNLILIRSDHGEPGDPHQGGDAGEMRDYFAGWDEILNKILSLVPRVQKWKICTPPKVDTAIRGGFAILGDAFHSNLPYQAQGAAMAMEDGAFLGKILGLARGYVLSGRGDALDADSSETQLRDKHEGDVDLKKLVPAVLEGYGAARGTRASDAVRGEGRTEPVRKWFHLPDGPEQEARDAALSHTDVRDRSAWRDDCLSLLGYDVVQEAEKVTAAVLEVR